MLLARTAGPASDAVGKLVGLQAQAVMAPSVGLWTRVEGFRREDLASAVEDRSVLKATMMRATLHLVTTPDYLRFRSTLQPVLSGALQGIRKNRAEGLDVPALLEAARPFLAEAPRSFAEITEMANALLPGNDPGAMRYAIRTQIPLVQVPVPTGWSYPGNPKYTLAESWIGRPLPPEEHFKEMVLRYLAAFGPASVTDIQAWSGFTKLKEAIEKIRPELSFYRDENRRELFDHPGLPIEDPGRPAPERFLPEFDNILLSYSKRTRMVADEFRSRVYVPVLRVRSTILVDGFVAGTWRTEKSRGTATLVIEPFGSLSRTSRQNLSDEGERLIRFIGYDAERHEVKFED